MKSPELPTRRGLALVIILALVVLLTFLAVAFLSRTVTNRQMANASAAKARADLLAKGAAELVVAGMNSEIIRGSSTNAVYQPGSDKPFFMPVNNRNMVPRRIGNPGELADVKLFNLNRRSMRQSDFDAWKNADANLGADFPAGFPNDLVASEVSTSDPSADGKRISAERWNRIWLFDPSSPNFKSPDWILITRGGPKALAWDPKLADGADPANSDYVLGRVAYMIYDQGGLLNVNAAGFPGAFKTSNPDDVGRKGSVALADLSALPGIDTPDLIVNWRSRISGLSASSFLGDFLTDWLPVNGFGPVFSSGGKSDNRLLSRSELIQYIGAMKTINKLSLQYLTTFSRQQNRSNWCPGYDASDSQFGGSAAAAFQYKSNALAGATSIQPPGYASPLSNPNLLVGNVRASKTFYRLNGELANVNDPLVTRRFPLSRLAWIGANGFTPQATTDLARINSARIAGGATPIADEATLIQAAFGLVWKADSDPSNPRRWVYAGATGSSPESVIKTLTEITDETLGREPNFFELLKLGMLHGSLGKTAGDPGAGAGGYFWDTAARTADVDQNPDLQVLRVGANMIDQADEDSKPTTIELTNNSPAKPVFAWGKENLPYIHKIPMLIYRPESGGATRSEIGWWLLPEFWNPHQNSSQPPADVTKFRFIAQKGALTGSLSGSVVVSSADSAYGPPALMSADPSPLDFSRDFAASPGSFTFSSADFSAPKRCSSLLGSPSSGNPRDGLVETALDVIGLNIQYLTADFQPYKLSTDTGTAALKGKFPYANNRLAGAANNFPVFELQYWDSEASTWRSYDAIENVQFFFTLTAPGSNAGFGPYATKYIAGDVTKWGDPRSNRFGAPLYPFSRPEQTMRKNESFDDSTYGSTIDTPGFLCAPRETIPNEGSTSPSPSNLKHSPRETTPVDPPNIVTTFAKAPGWTADISNRTVYASIAKLQENHLALNSEPFAISKTRYSDYDGITRPADGYMGCFLNGTTITSHGNAMQTSGGAFVNKRPIILNRPFRSVGELGYVFRDQPWKSLDFFSPYSADEGLLDLFCINDVGIEEGQININRCPTPVLKSILMGAGVDEKNFAAGLNLDANLDAYLPRLQSRMATPVMSRAEMARRLFDVIPVPAASTSTPTANPALNDYLKIRREAVIRTLSEVSATSTWNLVIDVIAQAGRYPRSATDLKGFVVDAESRYWLHLAIDRMSGKVIDYQWETVNE